VFQTNPPRGLGGVSKGCACLRIADALGGVYRDKQFASLFPRRGQPAESPWRLALATSASVH
jgi:hypothetical protein